MGQATSLTVKIDLAQMAQRTRPTRRREVVFPPIEPTGALAIELERIYLAALRYWAVAVRNRVLPIYTAALRTERMLGDSATVQDDAGQLGGETSSIAAEVDWLLLILTPKLRDWALRVEKFHRTRWLQAILTPTGVDLSTMIGPEDAARTFESVIEQNVSLIRSVTSEARTKVEGIVFRGFTARTPSREIAKEIREALGTSRARSIRIASDQTAKLSAQLDTERMRQAGITDWRWVHSGKLHFRPEHKRRNGRIYSFAKPPPDMPGELPFCGCKKAAVLRLASGRWATP
jgi:SPP1 gp7 family putative phage head morphogenesis protein